MTVVVWRADEESDGLRCSGKGAMWWCGGKKKRRLAPFEMTVVGGGTRGGMGWCGALEKAGDEIACARNREDDLEIQA
jgi:hypothetical protein